MGTLVTLYGIFGEIQKGLDSLGPDLVFQNRNGLAIEFYLGRDNLILTRNQPHLKRSESDKSWQRLS